MRSLLLALLVGLVLFLPPPAAAQYTTLGRNPVVRGGLPGASVPAGCEVHGLPADLKAQMRGASGEVVWATFSKNEAMVMRPLRTEGEWAVYQVLTAIRCGNPLVGHHEVRFKVPTKVTVQTRTVEKIVIQEKAVDRPVYVFSPTVYPTAPMPQPVIQTFVNRPQANFGLNFVRVNHSGDRPTVNLFGGQGGAGGAGGSVGAITNTNSQQQQQNLFNQNQNINPTNVTVGTGSGNTTGTAGGTGNQTGTQPQTQGQ